MVTIRQGSRICIDAPAKINLFLELRERRADGFHELDTLMATVNIFDRLELTDSPDHLLHFYTRRAVASPSEDPLPSTENNLAYRALRLLRQRAGVEQGASVTLLKRIPSQAGLGGASSDAAAALVGGNALWKLGWSRAQLAELGAELGSDVPFFLYGGMANCTGRGEIISPLETKCSLPFVVVKPAVGLSTAKVYQHSQVPDRPRESRALQAALAAGRSRQAASCLFNRLQDAAESLEPEIHALADCFDKMPVCGHQMSGSGTSYFAVCRNRRHADHVAARLRAQGKGTVFSATTCGRTTAL